AYSSSTHVDACTRKLRRIPSSQFTATPSTRSRSTVRSRGRSPVSHGITVTPDRPLSGIDAGAYDLVALPGGMPGTLHLREHADVRRIVRELASRGRYTTAICAAPTVLAAAGVTAGRAVTSHPSVAAELAQAGTTS